MNTEWMNAARCREVDPELFNPERGQSNRDALRVCASCEVREPCLEYALKTGQAGIWGGTSDKQRRALRAA